MPKTETGTTSTTNTRSSKEMADWYAKNKNNIENYAEVSDAIKLLRDVTKTTNVSVSAFDKDVVINYLQNIGSNEQNLRKLSQYLFWRSQIYYRIIDFYASMFELDCRTVVPSDTVYNPVKKAGVNDQKLIKNYFETVNWLDIMHLQRHFHDPLTVAFREDVFFGLYWLDEEGLIIIKWDPQYARIDGVYNTGNFSFSIDVTWFRSRQDILEIWGSPFTEMYKEYERTGVKWQHVDEEHGLCLKYNSQDYDVIVPPFVGLFLSLISLEDLGDLTAIQDEMSIYKLLVYKLKGLSGVKDSDKFEVSPTAGAKYFNKFVNEALPAYTSAAMLPGSEDLQVVSFSDDATTDTNKIAKATEAILNTAGGAEVLNGATINSSAAFNAAMIAAMNFALGSLLPQIEGWVEMVLRTKIKNPSKVKFHYVTTYTKEKFKEELLSGAQNGMPVVFSYMGALAGFSEKDTMALNALQNALDIPNILQPVQSSYTTSGTKGEIGQGRDKVDDTEISPSGDRSRNE